MKWAFASCTYSGILREILEVVILPDLDPGFSDSVNLNPGPQGTNRLIPVPETFEWILPHLAW